MSDSSSWIASNSSVSVTDELKQREVIVRDWREIESSLYLSISFSWCAALTSSRSFTVSLSSSETTIQSIYIARELDSISIGRLRTFLFIKWSDWRVGEWCTNRKQMMSQCIQRKRMYKWSTWPFEFKRKLKSYLSGQETKKSFGDHRRAQQSCWTTSIEYRVWMNIHFSSIRIRYILSQGIFRVQVSGSWEKRILQDSILIHSTNNSDKNPS